MNDAIPKATANPEDLVELQFEVHEARRALIVYGKPGTFPYRTCFRYPFLEMRCFITECVEDTLVLSSVLCNMYAVSPQ